MYVIVATGSADIQPSLHRGACMVVNVDGWSSGLRLRLPVLLCDTQKQETLHCGSILLISPLTFVLLQLSDPQGSCTPRFKHGKPKYIFAVVIQAGLWTIGRDKYVLPQRCFF